MFLDALDRKILFQLLKRSYELDRGHESQPIRFSRRSKIVSTARVDGEMSWFLQLSSSRYELIRVFCFEEGIVKLLPIVGEIHADGLMEVSWVYRDFHEDVEGLDRSFSRRD